MIEARWHSNVYICMCQLCDELCDEARNDVTGRSRAPQQYKAGSVVASTSTVYMDGIMQKPHSGKVAVNATGNWRQQLFSASSLPSRWQAVGEPVSSEE